MHLLSFFLSCYLVGFPSSCVWLRKQTNKSPFWCSGGPSSLRSCSVCGSAPWPWGWGPHPLPRPHRPDVSSRDVGADGASGCPGIPAYSREGGGPQGSAGRRVTQCGSRHLGSLERRAGAQSFPRSRRGSGSATRKRIRNPWAEWRDAKRVDLKWSYHTRTMWDDGSINDLDCGDHFIVYGAVLSPTQLSPTLCSPMDCSRPAPLSIGIPQARIWSGFPCPPPGDLPNPGLLHCGQIPYRLSLRGALVASEYIRYTKTSCVHLKHV